MQTQATAIPEAQPQAAEGIQYVQVVVYMNKGTNKEYSSHCLLRWHEVIDLTMEQVFRDYLELAPQQHTLFSTVKNEEDSKWSKLDLTATVRQLISASTTPLTPIIFIQNAGDRL